MQQNGSTVAGILNLVAMVDAMPEEPDGSILDGRRNRIGIVSWEPGQA